MHYYSTNRNSDDVSFRKATVNGIAEDGGVYVPADIPVVPEAFFQEYAGYGSERHRIRSNEHTHRR